MIRRKMFGFLGGGGVTHSHSLRAFLFAAGMLTLTANARNIYITPDADGTGDGSSWESPMMLTNYLVAANLKNGDIVRLKSGHYTAKIAPVSFGNITLTISGGYAGTDDDKLDENYPYSDIDFANYKDSNTTVYSFFLCKAKAGYSLTLERLQLRGARSAPIYKLNAGALHLSDCHIISNGWRNYTSSHSNGGRGIHAENGSLTLSKCKIAYNGMYFGSGSVTAYSDHGYGLYLNGTSTRLTDCTFIGNGAKISDEAPVASLRGGGRGVAIYATGAKVNAEKCDFICNRGALGSYSGTASNQAEGGIVVFVGNCNGSTFTNCSWVANQNLRDVQYNGNTYYGGVLTLDMSSRDYTVSVDKCTFAYNITDSSNAAAGIDVRNGTLNLSNSIFAGNKARDGNTLGVDLVVRTNGTANVEYCLFSSKGNTNITVEEIGEDKGILSMKGIVEGEAELATDKATASALVKTRTKKPYLVYDPEKIDEVLAFDVHARSKGGRWTADGFLKDKVHSPSIDAGDPDASYGGEPKPHGRRLNLGRYGGTEEASRSRPTGLSVIIR
ncbi:MAG: hypothetical protein IKC27_02925 [Kiritimatiellae bacterium]|nr:hypothetical protein [Kiritimatiellia bacterium]